MVDLHSKILDTRLPFSPIFMHFSGKIAQVIGWRPTPFGFSTPSGKPGSAPVYRRLFIKFRFHSSPTEDFCLKRTPYNTYKPLKWQIIKVVLLFCKMFVHGSYSETDIKRKEYFSYLQFCIFAFKALPFVSL